jgi:hypothetical protein
MTREERKNLMSWIEKLSDERYRPVPGISYVVSIFAIALVELDRDIRELRDAVETGDIK